MTGYLAGELIAESTEAVVVDRLFVADTFWSRFRGLQFLRALPPDTGLLLRPCSSIHTFWMRFSIDVLFLDRRGTVIETRRAVRPWRIAFPSVGGCCQVLEVAAGQGLVSTGERLLVRDARSGIVTELGE